MEEPKKVLKAQYLGSTEVNQPTGMEVLNKGESLEIAYLQPFTHICIGKFNLNKTNFVKLFVFSFEYV